MSKKASLKNSIIGLIISNPKYKTQAIKHLAKIINWSQLILTSSERLQFPMTKEELCHIVFYTEVQIKMSFYTC